MKRTFKLWLNGCLMTVLLAALFAFAMFQGDRVSWFLFFGHAAIYVYLIILLCYPMKNWRVKRITNEAYIEAGQSVEVVLEVKRKTPVPIYYAVVEEMFSESLNQLDFGSAKYQDLAQPTITYRRMKRIVFPGFKRKFTFSYQIEHIPRGIHELVGVRIETSDLFGVVKKEALFPVKDILIAMPKEKKIPARIYKANQQEGSNYSAFGHEQTNIATGVRPYVAGDRMAAINWKQSAKRQELMTREYDRETGRERMLLLDARGKEQMNHLTFEASIEIALYMANTLAQRERLSFLLVTETINKRILADKPSIEQLKRDLTELDLVSPQKSGAINRDSLNQLKKNAEILAVVTNLDETSKMFYIDMNKRVQSLVLLCIEARNRLDYETRQIIEQLRAEGVHVTMLDEQVLSEEMSPGVHA